MKKYIPILLIVMFSCGKEGIEIENFHQEAWKEDPFGCNDQRRVLAHYLLKNKEELLGHNSHRIRAYLGNPDRTELYKRNQKFFHYFISPGPGCDGYEGETEHDRLTLRFNATNLLKEISLYD